ncbi:MAG: T9SS type A sorting domain-containing protein [Flavobacteriales bacterium]|nr:T9SS type A sorting domain-containing protein [Flavobacteriales bacterium]MBL6873676.1 T9SS type A sorting domain-containing protein [Flavobacteriales bacterium]
MFKKLILFQFSLLFTYNFSFAQAVVPIINYSVNNSGQALLSIEAEEGKYYVLTSQHSPTFEWATTVNMGVNGTMIISDPGGAYPIENYTVTEYDISNPGDIDGDEIDDVTEFNNMPTDAPINFAQAIDFEDGATSIPDAETFMGLATINNVGWAPFLDGQLYVKFGILDRDTPEPKVYFINSNTYTIHGAFFAGIGATVTGDDGSGEIVFNPNTILPGGVIGSYSFNFSFGNTYDFEATQRTYELLVANMPFLQNNLNHFISEGNENNYMNNYVEDFEGTRINVVLESDVFGDINYIPFHEAEGYGYFKHMEVDETPGSRDIVLYDALPNSLPRVGGIITSVIQTPLSHVNLRAIQDNVPNAYIQDPLSIDSISNLLNNYVYYKVENETFQFREATLDEVNEWYEAIRPTEPQIPVRDLSITEILPLDDIEFEMSTAFGAKCSNVATMRSFGLPDGTIPDGFGIPFYFYDEFMQYNNFYLEAQVMIDNPAFQNDINFRVDRLKMFRDDIKDAPMPSWMMDQLQAMHDDFPVGTKVRCRSSTNNEDLPGFSGAGLYTSKTQHLDEGHISKSIKQVYASMWNFRAYEERDFYRVDHFMAAMGVLCHPNFEEEKSNGVGISLDPIYETENTFYLNTQVGESLITNPDPNSVPEEILLYEDPENAGGYLVLQLSNLVEQNQLVMGQSYLDQMRDYLSIIHDEFAILYNVEGVEGFGMDIEYKVTAQDQLAIKQARPWVSFWADIKADNDLEFTEFISPVSSSDLGNSEAIKVVISNTGLNPMSDFTLTLLVDDQEIETLTITETLEPFSNAEFEFQSLQDFSNEGDYNLRGIVSDVDDEYGNNDTLNYTLTKIHQLDATVYLGTLKEKCNNEIEATITIENNGGNTINNVQFEIFINGESAGIFNEEVDISSLNQDDISVIVDGNFQTLNNEVTINVFSVNGQADEVPINNFATAFLDVLSTYDFVTFILNSDQYPYETSWSIFDFNDNIIASGDLSDNGNYDTITEQICLDYASCYSLIVYDSYGDGIFSPGNFSVLNSSGETIVFNDGTFGSQAIELLCPGGSSCEINADVVITHSFNDDGVISIFTPSSQQYNYSIDGGMNFTTDNIFSELTPGEYFVIVQDEDGICSYEEMVYVNECTLTSIDVESTNVSSVVVANGAIIITPTSGLSPYLFSVDGGQNFEEDNEFYNLAVGNYNVVVQDASGVCEYEVNVPVEVDESNDVIENSINSNDILIHPNPTKDQIYVEFNSNSEMSEEVYIEVYDNSSRLISSGSLLTKNNAKTMISLGELESGIYHLKCYNKSFNNYFKVVKIK